MALTNYPCSKLILHFVDRAGKKGTMEFWRIGVILDPDEGGMAAITDATAAMTDVGLVAAECQATAIETSPGTPSAGAFDRVTDKLQFKFRAEDGSPIFLDLGSLKSALLNADGITLNVTDGTTAGHIATLQANLVSAEGAAIVSLMKAFRRRPPNVKAR